MNLFHDRFDVLMNGLGTRSLPWTRPLPGSGTIKARPRIVPPRSASTASHFVPPLSIAKMPSIAASLFSPAQLGPEKGKGDRPVAFCYLIYYDTRRRVRQEGPRPHRPPGFGTGPGPPIRSRSALRNGTELAVIAPMS